MCRCELCQYQYTVACGWWASALNHSRVQALLTIVLVWERASSAATTSCSSVTLRHDADASRAVQLALSISLGSVVWDGWTRFFVAVCYEPQDSFRSLASHPQGLTQHPVPSPLRCRKDEAIRSGSIKRASRLRRSGAHAGARHQFPCLLPSYTPGLTASS